jgi:hypothetical protein
MILTVGTSVFVLFCVADYRRYNLYFIVCSNLAMSERLLSGIFTKEQSFSGADNSKNTKTLYHDYIFF